MKSPTNRLGLGADQRPFVEFWSSDDRFGVRIPKEQISIAFRRGCRAYPKETGGVIVGRYTTALDCAVVESFTPPPKDSRSGTTWFTRGVSGLKSLLVTFWKTGQYYLGEWHVHPDGETSPSSKDLAQMMKIIESKEYDCDTPLLVIIGTTSDRKGSIGVFVHGGDKLVELFQIDE